MARSGKVGIAWLGEARQEVITGQGDARMGEVATGTAGVARIGADGLGPSRHGRIGASRSGLLRHGAAGFGTAGAGEALLGKDRKARQVRLGLEWR